VTGGAIGFGQVRFIRPTSEHPEIRLRFVPAHGLIYGPNHPNMPETTRLLPRERLVYDTAKGRWCGFEVKQPEDPGKITPYAPLGPRDPRRCSRMCQVISCS